MRLGKKQVIFANVMVAIIVTGIVYLIFSLLYLSFDMHYWTISGLAIFFGMVAGIGVHAFYSIMDEIRKIVEELKQN